MQHKFDISYNSNIIIISEQIISNVGWYNGPNQTNTYCLKVIMLKKALMYSSKIVF